MKTVVLVTVEVPLPTSWVEFTVTGKQDFFPNRPGCACAPQCLKVTMKRHGVSSFTTSSSTWSALLEMLTVATTNLELTDSLKSVPKSPD